MLYNVKYVSLFLKINFFYYNKSNFIYEYSIGIKQDFETKSQPLIRSL